VTEYKVSWTELARDDLLQVVDFIAEDNPVTAERILEQLSGRAATLERMPQRGRKVPDLCDTRVAAQRELIVRPWRLFYVIKKDRFYVTALFDGRRDVARLLEDRVARGWKMT